MTLLGPDGQPLDLDRLRTKQREEAVEKPRATNGSLSNATVGISDEVHDWSFDVAKLLYANRLRAGHVSLDGEVTRKPKPLAERVADDVEALTADLDFEGRPELPRPTPDLTAYADALDVAIRSCPHQNVEDTIHSRGEYQCQDCGRYLSRDDMRRRASANPFGWYFR